MANDPRTCDTDDVKFVDWSDVIWAGRFEVGRLGVIVNPAIKDVTPELEVENI